MTSEHPTAKAFSDKEVGRVLITQFFVPHPLNITFQSLLLNEYLFTDVYTRDLSIINSSNQNTI